MEKPESVAQFISFYPKYEERMQILRDIILETGLDETIKWRMPVYMDNGKNVISMYAAKDYYGIWFFEGVFLKDKAAKLINAQEGKTHGMRQWRFKDKDQIDKSLIKEYIEEAIQNSRDGLRTKPNRKKITAVEIPDLLREALDKHSATAAAYQKMSPYKQREYAEYISSAKREATQLNRLNKILPMIKKGQGLNDKYR